MNGIEKGDNCSAPKDTESEIYDLMRKDRVDHQLT